MLSSKSFFIILVTLSVILTYLAAEIYLPAMPPLQHWLGCSTSELQTTVSIFAFGIAVAQFIGGPIIDRFSYRHIALLMAVVFAISSIYCAVSTTLLELNIARLFQAFSTGILAIIGRASLPKKFEQEEVMRIYLLISPIFALSLTFSPLIGGYLTQYLGWPSVFYFLAFLGGILFLLTYKFLFISQPAADSISLHPLSILKTYASLVQEKPYVAAIFALSAVFAQNFAYLAETPFIFAKLNYTSDQIGRFYILISVAFVVGSWFTRKYIKRLSYEKLTVIGFLSNFISIALMIGISLYGIQHAYQIYLPSSLIGFGNGILIPLITGKAIAVFPKKSGYASGFMSATTLLASAIATAIVHKVTLGSVTILAIFMGIILLLGFIGFVSFHFQRSQN